MAIKTNDSAFEIKKAWKEKQAEADKLKAEMMKEQYKSEVDAFATSLLSNQKVLNTFDGLSKKERSIFFKSIITNFDTIFALSQDERNKYRAAQEKKKNAVKNPKPIADNTATQSAASPAPQVVQQAAPAGGNVVQNPIQNTVPNAYQGVSQ